jgi:hypothetical protein
LVWSTWKLVGGAQSPSAAKSHPSGQQPSPLWQATIASGTHVSVAGSHEAGWHASTAGQVVGTPVHTPPTHVALVHVAPSLHASPSLVGKPWHTPFTHVPVAHAFVSAAQSSALVQGPSPPAPLELVVAALVVAALLVALVDVASPPVPPPPSLPPAVSVMPVAQAAMIHPIPARRAAARGA